MDQTGNSAASQHPPMATSGGDQGGPKQSKCLGVQCKHLQQHLSMARYAFEWPCQVLARKSVCGVSSFCYAANPIRSWSASSQQLWQPPLSSPLLRGRSFKWAAIGSHIVGNAKNEFHVLQLLKALACHRDCIGCATGHTLLRPAEQFLLLLDDTALRLPAQTWPARQQA